MNFDAIEVFPSLFSCHTLNQDKKYSIMQKNICCNAGKIIRCGDTNTGCRYRKTYKALTVFGYGYG